MRVVGKTLDASLPVYPWKLVLLLLLVHAAIAESFGFRGLRFTGIPTILAMLMVLFVFFEPQWKRFRVARNRAKALRKEGAKRIQGTVMRQSESTNIAWLERAPGIGTKYDAIVNDFSVETDEGSVVFVQGTCVQLELDLQDRLCVGDQVEVIGLAEVGRSLQSSYRGSQALHFSGHPKALLYIRKLAGSEEKDALIQKL